MLAYAGGALEQSFRAFDKHGTGGLSKDELFKLLKSLGFNYSRKQVEVALEPPVLTYADVC